MNLIELTREAQRLLSLVEDSGGEITPEIETALDVNSVSLATKVDGYGYLLDRLPALVTYWKDQRDQAARVARGLEAFEKRLKDNLKYALIEAGMLSVSGGSVKFSVSPSAAALELNESELPREYLMTVTTLVPDKERIRADLEAGVEIPGAALRRGTTLRRAKSRAV